MIKDRTRRSAGDRDVGARDRLRLEKRVFVFSEGGGSTGEGGQQKAFQETQSANLLIRARLLQCVVRSAVRTCARVHGCE